MCAIDMAPDPGEIIVEWVPLEKRTVLECFVGNVVWECICVEGYEVGEFLGYSVRLARGVVFYLDCACAQK